jgi:peptidoglycan/xylan/chitin deacetylase (PgdA/CDA1 family)
MYRPNNRLRVNTNDFTWKGGKRIAVIVNIPYEGWSEGAHSGVGPMGNILKPGFLDTNAISWGMYGAVRGIHRLLRVLDRQKVTASVMLNGCIAELYPETVREVVSAGHKLLAHSYAMDIMPVYLTEEEERQNIQRTLDLIGSASGQTPIGWISPRATPSMNTVRLLSEYGFSWHGDAYDDDLPYLETYGVRSIVAIPLTMEINDMPWAVRYGNSPRDLVTLLKYNIESLLRSDEPSISIDLTAHTHVYGRPLGAAAFEELLSVSRGYTDVWITNRDEVCEYMRDHFDGVTK